MRCQSRRIVQEMRREEAQVQRDVLLRATLAAVQQALVAVDRRPSEGWNKTLSKMEEKLMSLSFDLEGIGK
jgi:hypothetical protein